MTHPNLLVLVNSTPSAAIADHFPDYEIWTDVEFFPILNGQKSFMDGIYNHESYKELAEAIEEYSKDRKILIHSFNPLIHNFLEVGDGECPNFKTDIESCAKRFIIYTYDKSFSSLFDIPSVIKKMDVMGVGEAICDTYLVEAITDELANLCKSES